MDIIEKIINNVEKTAKTVVQKSNDVVEITKLKMANQQRGGGSGGAYRGCGPAGV